MSWSEADRLSRQRAKRFRAARGIPALLVALAAALAASRATAGEREPRESGRGDQPLPVVLDTDIGTWSDDAFALALVLASPELELRGVTTSGGDAEDRAWIACRFLTATGRSEVPVAWGRAPQPDSRLDGQIQYQRHPSVIWNRTSRPVEESAVELLRRLVEEGRRKTTLIALGPLTNIARLLERHPETEERIERIVLMGGALEVGYEGRPPAVAEGNIRADVPAARKVFSSGMPLVVAPLDATAGLELEERLRERLFSSGTPLTYQVEALYQLSGEETPVLFDPAAVALAFEDRFFTLDRLRIEIGDDGTTRRSRGEPNARVATSASKEEFLDWLVGRLASFGKPVRPRPPGNPAREVARGNFPERVHVVEDFETDIEERWWLSGRLEASYNHGGHRGHGGEEEGEEEREGGKEDVRPGSDRALRGVLTQDFDARMGDLRAMYTAVVFNPVPGPPMGERTRLAFRYKIEGSDTLRAQIFSLSKGYHRHLTLTGLAQGEWRAAAVDMTEARRPDGSGGPLSADERIDDIQFYTHPSADLWIDDIVLYEAAAPEEKRPFPRRVIFTGWFDTGRQGKEWPGDFEIVPHEPPRRWKAARSVPNPELGRPWIRVHLRGERRLAPVTALRFLHRLEGASSIEVALVHSETGREWRQKLAGLEGGAWREVVARFEIRADAANEGAAAADAAGNTDPGGDGDDAELPSIDEVRFVLAPGAELAIDDVLLYEP